VDDPSGAHVGVAHFAVAHLTVRQAHVHTGSADGGGGIFSHEPVNVGFLGGGNGVAPDMVRDPAKTVHNAEHYRFLAHKKVPLSFLGLLGGCSHDGGKVSGLEGCAADEAAVHVRLGYQLLAVPGV